MFYLQQKQEEEQTACLHIKWNSCACVLATMYKQEIFVQIPHKYHPISSEIQTDEQTQYKALKNFTKFEERFFFFFFLNLCAVKSGGREQSGNNSTYQSLLLCLYCAHPF